MCAFLDEAGRTVLDWSDPIPAPARDDESADARLTGAIMDILERAVGMRPGQYVLPVGDQRRWSETAKCWVELDDAIEVPAGPGALMAKRTPPSALLNDQSVDGVSLRPALDILERAIGMRPGQFVLPVGHERRWDEATQMWAPHKA